MSFNDEDGKLCIHMEGKFSKIIIDEEYCEKFKTMEKPPVFVLGFTGAGLIGVIVVNELISQLKMEQIGYLISEDLPPITLFYEGLLKHPFRVYYSEEHNIVASICEVPFVQVSYTDISRTLMNWALHSGIKDIICLQGMRAENYIPQEDTESFVAGEKAILDKFVKQGVKKIQQGIIVGAEAAILNECMNNQLDGAVLMAPANPKIPSPEGSAAILKEIATMYNLPIKMDKLKDQAGEIKEKMFALAEKSEDIHQSGSPMLGTGKDSNHYYT